jgi:4-amino-4-deoxy-L-arabinose transferase-like glycosyltransferase
MIITSSKHLNNNAGATPASGNPLKNLLSVPHLLILFACYAWVSTAILMSRSMPMSKAISEFGVGAAALAIFITLSAALRLLLPPLGEQVRELLSDRKCLFVALVAGILLRLIWTLAFQPQPMSDGLTYLHFAGQLVAGEGFGDVGAMAYWPPGYAYFLAVFLLFLPPTIAVFISQTLLFIGAAVGIYKVAQALGTSAAAGLSVALFALWPNLIALGGTPEKELLVTALLVWAAHAGIRGTTKYIWLTGLLLGCSALVQPATQLLIPVAAILLLFRFGARRWTLIPVLLLGAAIAIAPWTARNFLVFGQFKLISTNGGDVLYRANNPLATGGYTPVGEVDLSSLGELEREPLAKNLAVRWIGENPAAFVWLSLEKQILFMGDDAYGVYATFRSLGDKREARAYMLLKSGANFWWLLIWLAATVRILQGGSVGQSAFLVIGWGFLFSLHSIFESGGRYHISMLWVLCILFGGLFLGTTKKSASVMNELLITENA